jgi:hypothetical protein
MLAEAGRIVIEENRRVATVFGEFGPRACAYRSLPEAPPLCFMHIPKTGGASAIAWLESMFHAEELAPCRNSGDFDSLQNCPHPYRLFAGHFLGSQAPLFPADAQWMTILRDPVEMAVSAYHHRRLAPKGDWEKDRASIARGDGLRGDDSTEKALAEAMTELFQKVDMLTAIRQRDVGLRSFFRDTLTRRLGAEPEEHEISMSLSDDSPRLASLRERQWDRAIRLLDRIDLIGDQSALEPFLLLIAASRGWPAPPPLPRIHDFGAPTRQDAACPELREQFREYSPIDIRIYQRAREKSDKVSERLRELCGDVTARAVDDLHRRRFFAEAQQVLAFDVSAEEPWNGCGWGFRERDGMNNASRQIANGRTASMLVRLDPAIAEYRLFLHVLDVSSQAALEGFSAQVSEKPLERVGAAWRKGALILEWRVPSEVIVGTRGNLEFGFVKAEETVHERVSIARIGCVPALTFA